MYESRKHVWSNICYQRERGELGVRLTWQENSEHPISLLFTLGFCSAFWSSCTFQLQVLCAASETAVLFHFKFPCLLWNSCTFPLQGLCAVSKKTVLSYSSSCSTSETAVLFHLNLHINLLHRLYFLLKFRHTVQYIKN
jgi:hypothetical protein